MDKTKTMDRYKIVSMYINNQTEENWNRLMDYIRKHNLGRKQKLTIPFTQADCEELAYGEEFLWNFETNKGEEIEIKIIHQEM
jgi:hypothetical protein